MTVGQVARRRCWLSLVALLLGLIAALAALLLGTTASASAAGVAETRVGAFNVSGEVLGGPPEHIAAGQWLGRDVARPVFVVATGVAAKSGDGLIGPGPFAGKSIPARGPARDFTRAERDAINDIGQTTGCHRCGATTPGTKSGDFVPDHQLPNSLNPAGQPQVLYPHCLACSREQGLYIANMIRRGLQ